MLESLRFLLRVVCGSMGYSARQPSPKVKHITSQDNFLIGGRSECRKGLSESVKVVENCSCQTMIFKASAQKDATEFSKEK
jgi:hypothetical protein